MTISLHVKLVHIKMPSLGCFATISNWISAGLNGIRDHIRGKFLVCQTVITVQTSKPAELKNKNERNSKVEVGLTEKKKATRTREIQIDKKEKSKGEKRNISQRKSKGKSQKSKSSNNVSTSPCHPLLIPNPTKGRRLPPIKMKIKGRPLPPIPNNKKKNSLPSIASNKKDEKPEKMMEIEEYNDDDDIVFAGDNKKVCTVPQEVEHDDDDDIVFPGINDAKKVPSSKLQNEQNHVMFSTKVSGNGMASDLKRTRSSERSHKSFKSAGSYSIEDHEDDDDSIVSGINDKVQDLPQKLEYDDDDDIVFPGINDKVYSPAQPPQYDDDDDIIFSSHASRKDKKPSSPEEKSPPRNGTENMQHARSSSSSYVSGAVVFKKKCSLPTPSLTKIDV